MEKAIHIKTGKIVYVLGEIDDSYVNVIMDNEEKSISSLEIEYISEPTLSNFDDLNQSIFSSLITHPVSDLLYSYNSNRLIPQYYQYRPLIKMLKSPNNRLLIADEVGLGKTIEAGMILKEIDKREDVEIVLIVVPSSLTLKWKQEMLLRFSEDFEVLKVNEFRNFLKDYQLYSDSKVFNKKIILSYHSLRDESIIKILKETPLYIDVLIMDEAHTFRNNETSTFESVALLTGLAEHIVFLSATPVQNKIDDLFNILSLLDEENFLDQDHFIKTIQPNKLIHKVIASLKGRKNLDGIQDLIRSHDLDNLHMSMFQKELFGNFLNADSLTQNDRVEYSRKFTDADNLSYIINRTKKRDVGMFIPRKAVSHTILGTEEERIFYDEVVDFVKLLFKYRNPQIPSGFITIMPERMASSCMLASIESFEIMRKTRKFYVSDIDDKDDELVDVDLEEYFLERLDVLIEKGKAIGSQDSKYIVFEKMVDDLMLQNVNKMIVFSFFKKTLAYLEEKLVQKGLRVDKIDGDLSPEERFAKINDFRENKFDILLSSEVGSEGLDMQFCNVVINYDLPWNPMRVEQRIGRIDRIGQTAEKLLIFNLCIEGTIEDKILNRLYEKLNIFESSIGELEPILGDIENTFDMKTMITLSDEEIEAKIDSEVQSLIRQKKDIVEQNIAMDDMINDDYNFDESYEEYINSTKDNFVQKETEELFLNFLNQNNINYIAMKNDIYRLNSEESKLLLEILRHKIADAKDKAASTAQKRILNKLRKTKFFHFSFKKVDNQDYALEYISLSHTFIKMIVEPSKSISYASVTSEAVRKGYAVVYREEIASHKTTTTLHTLIFDDQLNLISTMDYYTFEKQTKNTLIASSINDLQEVKSKIEPLIIKSLELNIDEKKQNMERLLDQKIATLQEHYKKKRKYAQKMKSKVNDIDVIRMRQGQIQNIDELEQKRITALEEQKNVTGSYSILAMMEIIND